MNAYELLKPDHSPSGVWVCAKCGQSYMAGQAIATSCCNPVCETCGEPSQKYRILCGPCSDKRQAETEAKKFAKAEKVKDWDGWVWTDATSHNGGFFSDIGELIEWFNERYEEEDDCNPALPAYAWTCESTAFVKLSLDGILEEIEDDDDAYDDFSRNSLSGVKELGDAIKVFNEANKEIVSYHPCNNRVVLIHRDEQEGE